MIIFLNAKIVKQSYASKEIAQNSDADWRRLRFYGDAAVIRYQSKLKIVVDGEMVPLQRYWHTDSYEKRNGRWQIVWSQATLIQKP